MVETKLRTTSYKFKRAVGFVFKRQWRAKCVQKKQHFSYIFLCKIVDCFTKTDTTSVIIDAFKKFKLRNEAIDLLI